MCSFSFGLYFWVLIPNLYLVQNKCCFSVFVCLRPIFLILFINLSWNFSLSVPFMFWCGVPSAYIPIFFTNLNWNKCWFIPIFCHRCGKHLDVTISVRRCCCGLYFEGTSSKILTYFRSSIPNEQFLWSFATFSIDWVSKEASHRSFASYDVPKR